MDEVWSYSAISGTIIHDATLTPHELVLAHLRTCSRLPIPGEQRQIVMHNSAKPTNILMSRSFTFLDANHDRAEARYHGMVKCLPKGSTLKSFSGQHRAVSHDGIVKTFAVQLFSQNPRETRGLKVTTFLWDSKHTERDRDDCERILLEFISSYGGPHGRTQYLQSIDVFYAIWTAAGSIWRNPRVQGVAETSAK